MLIVASSGEAKISVLFEVRSAKKCSTVASPVKLSAGAWCCAVRPGVGVALTAAMGVVVLTPPKTLRVMFDRMVAGLP